MGKGKRGIAYTPTISPKQDVITKQDKSGTDTPPPALDGEVPLVASENPTIYGNSEDKIANLVTQASLMSSDDTNTKETVTHKGILK